MKNIIISSLFLIITFCWNMKAQQDPQYTQYMYNTMTVNPAYAGSRGVFGITALHRSQWVGLDGAPNTQTLNLNSPVSERVGLGLSILNDEIGNGTKQDTYVDGVFSYSIPISFENKISFGLKVGGHLLNIDFNNLKNYDPALNSADFPVIDKKFSPNFGAGIFYQSANFYAGLSVPNFLKTQHFDNSETASSYVATGQMHFYFISGYVFDLTSGVKFKPTLMTKLTKGAPFQVDLSANILFGNSITLGVAYRWDAALSALIGFQLNNKILIGLAYDKEITKLGNSTFNRGSFEVLMRYELISKRKNVLIPRFF